MRGARIGDQLHELDPQYGNLRIEALEVDGHPKGLLLLRGEGRGVETVLPGVPVVGLTATLATRRSALGGLLSIHGTSIRDRARMGKRRMAGGSSPPRSSSRI